MNQRLTHPKHPWVLNGLYVLLISMAVAAIASGITASVVSNRIGDKVTVQGQNGLQLFYTQALDSCRASRQNTLKLIDGFQQLETFSNVLDGQFKNGQKASRLIAKDPKSPKAIRKAAVERIAAYQKFIDILPHPEIPPTPPLCKYTVKSPAELAQQVRNVPGKVNTTTQPTTKTTK